MTEIVAAEVAPLWMVMEERIGRLAPSDLDDGSRETTIQRLARELDEAGHNVSHHAGNMLELRWAIEARAKVGRPLIADFNAAVGALGLADMDSTHVATVKLVRSLGGAWPRLTELDRRADVERVVDQRRLDLLVAQAKEMAGDKGIRFLIEREIPRATVVASLDISDARYGEVTAAIAAEQAEKARIAALLAPVADRDDVEKAKHLITNDVSDENILAFAGLGQPAIDAARTAMVEELREKQRKAEEEAAAKKAAAEGPALDAIPPAEMLDYIGQIREIMEFSDVEAEIRAMCEQSSIPKSLVDAVVTDPAKLDELEKAAEG